MAKRGAKGKYEEWLKPEKLEQIINWAAKGCTHEQIAHNMGISKNTFYVWLDKYYEINDAIKKGRMLSISCIENSLFKSAVGDVVVIEEIEEFKGTIKDGKPDNGYVIRRTIKKHYPPNVTAQIFYLKAKGGYKENPPDYSDNEILQSVDDILVKIEEATNGD